MKKSTKAALISALAFPGLGHMYLKKYLPGVILFGISFASIFYMISKTVQIALQIVEKIQSGAVQPDVASIMELISKQPTQIENGPNFLNIASAVFLISWLIGIIDSYRVGCVQDTNDAVLVNNQKGK